MNADDLDTIDWNILKELQREGRISNVQLASRVGLSPPPTLRRVQALEADGFITGYRARLAGEKLGYGADALAAVDRESVRLLEEIDVAEILEKPEAIDWVEPEVTAALPITDGEDPVVTH